MTIRGWAGEGGYPLALCLLAIVSYLPTLVFSLSTDPLIFDAGITRASKGGLKPGLPAIDPNDGTTTQTLGGLSARDLLAGKMPWWNPYAGVGLPLAAEMQSSSLFLPFVLLLWFGNGVVLLKIALQMVAGVATYALVRQLGAARTAAFCGAVLYEFNGTFAWLRHGAMMPIAFLPLLLLGVERALAFSGERRRGGWALIAISIAYSLYAGFPEPAFLDGCLALGWAVLRFWPAAREVRLRFGRKVVAGGISGLLIAAPIVVPFFEYQRLSAVSHAGFGHAAIREPGLLVFLLPYVFGPIFGFSGDDPSHVLDAIWSTIGGYLPVTVIFLSALALLGGKRDRALRFFLAVWMAIFVARCFSFQGWINALLSVIPGVDVIAMFRYIEPSLEMAGAVLAAYAIDDWLTSEGRRRVKLIAAISATVVLAGVAFWMGRKELGFFWHLGHVYRVWIRFSLGGALATLVAVVSLLRQPASGWRAGMLASVVALETIVLCGFPQLSGLRNAEIDWAPVHFLQAHLGLYRFYSMGPIHPSYSSLFGIASIDHASLPVAGRWMDYVHQRLDPEVDPVTFSGDYPGPLARREQMLRDRLDGYQEAGVKYVIAKPKRGLFLDQRTVSHSPDRGKARQINQGEIVSGVLPPDLAKLGAIAQVSVLVGTYARQVSGRLGLEICAGIDCARGQRELAEAQDNAPFLIPLEGSIDAAGRPIQYRFSLERADHPIAFWEWPVSGRTDAIYTPEISLVYAPLADAPKLVFRDDVADIFELAHPAPYFETNGGRCSAQVESRAAVRVACDAPAVLTRRELPYPGWRVSVNGHAGVPVRVNGIFQQIDLPKGEAEVEFEYEPSHIGWAYGAALVGLAGLAIPFARSRRRARRLDTIAA